MQLAILELLYIRKLSRWTILSHRIRIIEFISMTSEYVIQLCVRTLSVSQCDFELDTWTEIERIQQRRLQYHQSPLMILNPQNNSTAYILCVLTSIACQLEAESCLDVLQLLAAYKHKLCNVWRTQVNAYNHCSNVIAQIPQRFADENIKAFKFSLRLIISEATNITMNFLQWKMLLLNSRSPLNLLIFKG